MKIDMMLQFFFLTKLFDARYEDSFSSFRIVICILPDGHTAILMDVLQGCEYAQKW
jgi:hypothetical protein